MAAYQTTLIAKRAGSGKYRAEPNPTQVFTTRPDYSQWLVRRPNGAIFHLGTQERCEAMAAHMNEAEEILVQHQLVEPQK